MPIKVQSNLPAIKVLESENIFVMPNEVALRQDIRPLKILILNLMPTKIETETQRFKVCSATVLCRLISSFCRWHHTPLKTPLRIT